MKTSLLTAALFFAVVTTKAQNFTENFDGKTTANLTNSCWVLTGTDATNTSGQIISVTSIYTTTPPVNETKIDIYSPILNLASGSAAIKFDYKLTSALSGSTTRTIRIAIVGINGVALQSVPLVLGNGTNTDVKHFENLFTGIPSGNYRILVRFIGNGGGNIRVIMDNFEVTNATATNNGCSFTALAESTLPVKYKSFTAQLNNNSKVDLKWITSTELNASHFVIEKSYNGTEYNDIATVMAFGNTTDEKTYQFTDNNFTSDKTVVYYRLRQVDADGKEEYSAVRMVRFARQNQSSITVFTFPNPVSNELRVTIPNNWQGKKATYEIVNANGQTVRKTETAASSQTESINVSTLATGYYVVKVTCNGEVAQQKIVKQ